MIIHWCLTAYSTCVFEPEYQIFEVCARQYVPEHSFLHIYKNTDYVTETFHLEDKHYVQSM